MTETTGPESKRRNRNFEDTHRLLIKKATELCSKRGANALSVSALARATGINRTTVYYHFSDRAALLEAVLPKEQAPDVDPGVSQELEIEIDHISNLVLRNPQIIKLWIDDYLAVGDIRRRYPLWDDLVARVAEAFAEVPPDELRDAEVYCALMLTSALIAPRVLKPFEKLEGIVERFSRD